LKPFTLLTLTATTFALSALTLPLAAGTPSDKTPAKKWTFGLYGGTPSLSGHYIDNRDGEDSSTNFDIKNDLGLKTDGMGGGLYISYLGRRFGVSLDYLPSNYAGNKIIDRELNFSGETFEAGEVVSSLKADIIDFTWTIKVFRPQNAWVGIDLGIQAWNLDAKATGRVVDYMGHEESKTLNESVPVVPIPQIGISGGFRAFDDRLEARARASFIGYSGASYQRFGADARFYVLPWLGVRAFFDSQSFDAPDGSAVEDIEAKLDRSVFGFGVTFRF